MKIVKSALELHKKFDRYHGISPEARDETSFQHAVQNGEIREQRMCIPTTIAAVIADGDVGLESKKHTLLTELQLNRLSPDITLSFWTPPKSTNPVAVEHNPLRKALRDSLEGVQLCALASSNRPLLTVDLLVSSFPESYSVYKPLLLLPSHSLGAIWNTLLSEHGELFQPTWKHVAAALHCTHIALNSPIPPSNTADSAHANDNSNILRSPVNLTPIHGNFGPAPTPLTLSTPTTKDFDETLWVCTIQNGIHQTWAPLYTMFSRGNVKEKARILHLPTVASVTKTAKGATAVDMYGGIGYFSFSYRKAGIKTLLCWELNPWSVEGMRRGALLNGWTSRVFTPTHVPCQGASDNEWEAWRLGVQDGSEDFWIFQMSNDTAPRIIECLRKSVLPIRHVNLGLLPVSRLSWPAAVSALDGEQGGWIHAHENVGVVEMKEKREEVHKEFQRLIVERGVAGSNNTEWHKRKVQIEHVERVKMYAPGVVHAVFDVHIPGASIYTDP